MTEEDIYYLLKVALDPTAQATLASHLGLPVAPRFVRLSVLSPISNYGYPTQAQACLVAIGEYGVTVGIEGDSTAPRVLVPWQNICYLADGTRMWEELDEADESAAREQPLVTTGRAGLSMASTIDGREFLLTPRTGL